MPRRRALLASSAAILIVVAFASWIRHYSMHHATEIRYSSGEVARVGDRVDDNGQDAVVEEVLSTSEPAEVVGEDGVMKQITREPGLNLKWDIGLQIFRPISSENWKGIKLKGHVGGAT
jgi:hypothetical protein